MQLAFTALIAALQLGPRVKPDGDEEFASGARLQLAFAAQPLCRVERGDDNVLVARTAARVAGNADAHFLFGRVRIVTQKFNERRQNSRRTEAALQAVIVAECLLQRMQR